MTVLFTENLIQEVRILLIPLTPIRNLVRPGLVFISLFSADGFAYDSERYYINNRNTHVEVYASDVTGKFLTLTGKAIHGADVNERSKQLQVVLDKYMKRPDGDVATPIVVAPGSFLSDESVYAKVSKSKQADKFNALWNGEIPDGKSPSRSRYGTS